MSDLLQSLAARTVAGATPVIRPRTPSRFEPAPAAAITASLRDVETVDETATSVARAQADDPSTTRMAMANPEPGIEARAMPRPAASHTPREAPSLADPSARLPASPAESARAEPAIDSPVSSGATISWPRRDTAMPAASVDVSKPRPPMTETPARDAPADELAAEVANRPAEAKPPTDAGPGPETSPLVASVASSAPTEQATASRDPSVEVASLGEVAPRSEMASTVAPIIEVTIGRVEVRAVPVATRPSPPVAKPAAKLSLDAYLAERRTGQR